ncbi:MAG: AAA family ATPase [Candidatus Moranbacteria bacterium]|nr:AAA family ATPase [Candidatus Moranbacteria bacterium]
MFLKRLEISGFKSFANKTVLDFSLLSEEGKNHGVTAIVGPNGSGKSNIADSMRWVMGEQSMKNLRGKKSEDIIFAGSGKKSRLGSASVTLYFDNSQKKIPLDFDEITVTRKIYRSGESEYLVNGSRVRLQDIVDILAKAGVGKESNAIVNQGMADAVLNATPLERRLIIEEAAGVKQYQIKKERSLKKLASTRENLVRVASLVEELGPHLRLLKRQAEKAAEGETVAKNLKEKQLRLLGYLWHNFSSEKERLAGEKNDLGVKMMNIQREVDKLVDEMNSENKEEKDNQKLIGLEKEQRELRGKLGNLERELIVSEGKIEIEKEKEKSRVMIEEIKIKSIAVDFDYVKKGLDDIRQDQENLIRKINEAEKLEDLQDIKEFARVIQQKLHDLKADMEKGKKEEAMPENVAVVPEAPKANMEIIDGLMKRMSVIREEMKRTEDRMRQIEIEIRSEIDMDRKKRQHFFETERTLRVRQDELGRIKDKHNDSKVSLAKIEVREEDLRKQVVEELKMEVDALPRVEEKIDQFSLEREIAKLKFQMEQIGGIDPLVIEEYTETAKRYQFLENESKDLDNAIISLREIVREMDQKIAKEFHSAFDEINREFTKYFRIIFGGGNAHLTKLKVRSGRLKLKKENDESDDDLSLEEDEAEENFEIGIDISACPPGKKINNLSMLSGGERSLTSLALLFAIVSHNPPPFSVLDEVEAALDEANSKRFGRIIKELSGHTQFVIITHNRETMRQASLLYGVTMGEDGISKLLSVRLDQIGQGGKIIKS